MAGVDIPKLPGYPTATDLLLLERLLAVRIIGGQQQSTKVHGSQM